MKLSIVSPVYSAEKIVPELVKQIKEAVQDITEDYEIILVEDGSPDESWKAIELECSVETRVKGVKLSRNFGQHYAVTAGLTKASGENIVIMDCDLQDDPKHIKILLEKRNEGYEIIYTKRLQRKHGVIKSLNSTLYNYLFKLFSDKRYEINLGSLVLFSNRVKQEFVKLKDNERLYIQLLKWLGFKNTIIEVRHNTRWEGKSSYSFFQLIKLGIQGWTSYSDKLLRFAVYIGLSLSVLSFIFGISVIIRYFFQDFQPGWPSIILSIAFSTGLILMSIGIAGIYIGKIFNQSKSRPLFIIDKTLNE